MSTHKRQTPGGRVRHEHDSRFERQKAHPTRELTVLHDHAVERISLDNLDWPLRVLLGQALRLEMLLQFPRKEAPLKIFQTLKRELTLVAERRHESA